MDIHDLKILKTVAEKGNFTKAAEVLGYVQSNITSRIKHLENELQTNLFLRHHRGVTLTSQGETLLSYTNKIIQLHDEAIKATTNTPIPKGPLTIGALESTAASRLPNLLNQFIQSFPHVNFTLITGSTEELIQKVLNQEIDGAFIAGPCNKSKIISDPVVEEKLVFITPPMHQAIRSFQELENKKIFVYRSGCYYREKLECWLEEENVHDVKIIQFEALDVIVSSSLTGMGIGLIPYSFIRNLEQQRKIRCHPIPGKDATIITYFIRKENQYPSSAMLEFINMMQDHFYINSNSTFTNIKPANQSQDQAKKRITVPEKA